MSSHTVLRLSLPNELVETVIDQLGSHERALRACALVAPRWTARAQKHLFHTIQPTREAQWTRLWDVFTESPRLVELVRVVIVDSTFPFCLESEEEQSRIGFPNAHTLAFNYSHYDVEMLHLLPKLRVLKIRACQSVTPIQHWPSRPARWRKLKTIIFEDFIPEREFVQTKVLESLLDRDVLSEVDSAVLEWSNFVSCSTVTDFFRNSAHTLRDLTLIVYSARQHYGAMNIGRVPSLVTLQIITAMQSKCFGLVCAMLQQGDLPLLQEFSLELRPNEESFEADQRIFDATATVHDRTIPKTLATQLRTARVTFLELQIVRDVQHVKDVFRHVKPGVLKVLTAPGAVVRDD